MPQNENKAIGYFKWLSAAEIAEITNNLELEDKQNLALSCRFFFDFINENYFRSRYWQLVKFKNWFSNEVQTLENNYLQLVVNAPILPQHFSRLQSIPRSLSKTAHYMGAAILFANTLATHYMPDELLDIPLLILANIIITTWIYLQFKNQLWNSLESQNNDFNLHPFRDDYFTDHFLNFFQTGGLLSLGCGLEDMQKEVFLTNCRELSSSNTLAETLQALSLDIQAIAQQKESLETLIIKYNREALKPGFFKNDCLYTFFSAWQTKNIPASDEQYNKGVSEAYANFL